MSTVLLVQLRQLHPLMIALLAWLVQLRQLHPLRMALHPLKLAPFEIFATRLQNTFIIFVVD